jgi:hypothetical protein
MALMLEVELLVSPLRVVYSLRDPNTREEGDAL